MTCILHEGKEYTWPLSIDDFKHLYVSKKINGERLAAMFGVNSGTVSYLRNKYGIQKVESWERSDLPEKFSSVEREAVLGYLLGDGYLGKSANHAHLRVSQSEKQRSFVEQMYQLLKNWVSYEIVVDSRFDKRYEKEYFVARFDTVRHPVFSEIRQLCYPDGNKTITSEWLDQVGTLGLALWYEGDGHLSNNGLTPVLNTNSFSFEEHELIIKWFEKKWGIEARIKRYSKYNKINIVDGEKFKLLIKPHVIEYFDYKLPTKVRQRWHKT